MKKVILLILSFLFAMWLGGKLNALIFTPDVGVVVLSNESSEQICSAEISICGQTLTFSNVPTGEYVVAHYDIIVDSHYDIKVTLQSGRTLDSEVGYVTHMSDYIDIIAVTNDKIAHKSRKVTARY